MRSRGVVDTTSTGAHVNMGNIEPGHRGPCADLDVVADQIGRHGPSADTCLTLPIALGQHPGKQGFHC